VALSPRANYTDWSTILIIQQENVTYHVRYDWTTERKFLLIYYLLTYLAAVEPRTLLLWPFIGLLYPPWIIHDDDCRTISGMNNWQGKPKYSEKSAPLPLWPAQIPHDLIWARTRAAAVGSRRLTAWATVRPWERTLHRASTGSYQ
jgi:hypothetical protein